MLYREILPAPALRRHVRCFWHLADPAARGAGALERIVPDGCAEIVLNRAEPFVRVREGEPPRRQAQVLCVGQIRRPIRVAPTGAIDVLGIRFEPAGLHALCGVPMHELADRDECVGALDERLRDALARASETPALAERVAAVERVLGRALEARERRGTLGALAGAAVRLAERRGAPRGPGALARALGVGPRALERLFRVEVGLSPALFARIRRLQGVLAALEGRRPPLGWAALAAAHGYADQSHLIRDFRLLAGTTPERHLAERTPLAAHMEDAGASRSSNPAGEERA